MKKKFYISFLLLLVTVIFIFVSNKIVYASCDPDAVILVHAFTSGGECDGVAANVPIHFQDISDNYDEFTLYTNSEGIIYLTVNDYKYCHDIYDMKGAGLDCAPIHSYFSPVNTNCAVIIYHCDDGTEPYCDSAYNPCNFLRKPNPIRNNENLQPSKFFLYQNYPNPFNPVTMIKFELPFDIDLKLIIYDLTGKEIATLINGTNSKGIHTIDFDGKNYPSGVYIYKLETSQYTKIMKMVLLK